jgi:hypothetical protein
MGLLSVFVLIFVFVLVIIALLILIFVQFFDLHAPPLAGQFVEYGASGVVGS